MVITTENIIFIGSVLLLISIVVGKTSYKFGVPTLILFLTIGMLAGSDGIGGIQFDNPKSAQFVGIVSLNFILFSGGLSTKWNVVKPILRQGIVLSTFGVLMTAIILGLFINLVTDFGLYESLLLGSIVSSTDAAAVFSILRTRGLSLKHNLRPTLELESGSNDPMAYVLTILFLSLVVNPEQGFLAIIPTFFQQMILGAFFGILLARISKYVINNIKLDFEGLYSTLMMAIMFIIFSFTETMGGNGFLAIYIAGVYLGNSDLIHKKGILQMYDGLAWLMQIVLFLTLGLLVFPTQIVPYIGIGMLISLFLIVVARPISVFSTLAFFKMDTKIKTYISWVGLRGAVPIVFATYPLLAGIDKANAIFNIVFFIALTSVLIQGTTLSVIAKWLNLVADDPVESSDVGEFEDEIKLHGALHEIEIGTDFYAANRRIIDLNLHENAFIALIKRENKYFQPVGSSEILPGDILLVLTETKDEFEQVKDSLFMHNTIIAL